MGGGMSNAESMEGILAATYMVGRAIAAVAFPGMHRIYDFHSARAPKLKSASPFTLFQPNDYDSDEEAPDDLYSPEELEQIFHVAVGNDKIYIENPLIVNESGWTPLHACCMSFLTVQAGVKIIEEIVRQGGYLDEKTKIGPGTFNKGWTPLQMACAYGVEPLVIKLVEAGADVNCMNCYGYTPLLEACHRGFIAIAAILVSHGAKMDYIPPEELSSQSPFVSSPAQTALGEAARCGFSKIVKDLLDAGANKNQSNCLGWTALHEACFYNRIDVVKTLLLSGVDSSLRTSSGALPYHLAGLQVIRDMLSDMGCDGTLPRNDKDTVDMMRVLQELTYSAAERREMRDDEDVDRELNDTDRRHLSDTASLLSTSSEKGPTRTGASAGHNTSKHHSKHGNRSSKLSAGDCDEEEDEGVGDSDGRNEPLLHSGPVLGNLPALSPHKPISTTTSNTTSTGKKKKRGSSLSMQSAAASDVPPEFVCELCQKQMSDPVKSTYGNVFERSVIENWLKTQGHICPLTGAPLGETDLSPLDDLKVRIRKWILQRSIQPASDRPVAVEDGSADGEGGVAPGKTRMSAPRGSPHRTSTDDDLYDF